MYRSFLNIQWLGLLAVSLLQSAPAHAEEALQALTLTDSTETRVSARDANVEELAAELAQRQALDALLARSLARMTLKSTPEGLLVRSGLETLSLPVAEVAQDLQSLEREVGHAPLQRLLEVRLQTVEDQLRALKLELARQTGRVMPRKRDLGVDGLQAPPYTPPSQRLMEVSAVRDAYRQLLLQLGDDAARASLPAVAFRSFASVLRPEPDQWKRWPDARRSAFLDGGVFLITTARLAEEVHAFYEHTAMDRSELVHRTVARIERWLELYAKAPDSLTDFSGGRQTLTDMLYILGDDSAAATFIPDRERRRLLSRLAEAAKARGHYAEAIGAWSRLGDEESLIGLGRKLSNPLVQDLGHTLIVRREFGSAIEAFSVAEQKGALNALLQSCRQTLQGLEHESRPVSNRELLPIWIAQLTGLLADGPVAASFLEEVGQSQLTQLQPVVAVEDDSSSLADARLAELIDLYSRDLRTLSDDAARVSQALEKLEREALRRNQYDLALRAAVRPGNSASLMLLGEHFVQSRQWNLALEAFRNAGSVANAELKALGDRVLTGRTLVRDGGFEPMVALAVDAYILADAVEPLEELLPGLRGLNAELSRQTDAEARGIEALRATLQKIAQAYELDVVTTPVPTQTASSIDNRSSR